MHFSHKNGIWQQIRMNKFDAIGMETKHFKINLEKNEFLANFDKTYIRRIL